MDFSRNSRRVRMLNLVSLIDIIFTMILFFLVAGHMEKFALIPLELPQAESGKRLEEGPIEVILGVRHEIIVNDTLVEADAVEQAMREQLAHNPQRVITIKADAALAADDLVQFMEQVKAAGGRNLSLITQSGTRPVL
jgi:biopolymer transport protein ExbD